MKPRRCRHCGRSINTHKRHMCSSCYANPEIREQYAPVQKYLAQTFLLPTKQPQPTRALPGSAEKVAVLAARFAAGEYLWCRGDETGLE